MKLFKLSPLAAVIVGLPAFAAGPQAGDTVIYAAGATAQLNTLSNIFTKLCVNTPANPVEFYQGYSAAATSDTNLRAFRCTVGSGLNTGIDGQKVVFVYSAIGGSASGVQYVARQKPRTFLNFAACPAAGIVLTAATTAAPAGAVQFNCNIGAALTEQKIPVAGSSDVEPAQFVGVNTPAGETDITASELAALDVKFSRALIFGLLANDKMWLSLQKAQGLIPTTATVPIMPVTTSGTTAATLVNTPNPAFNEALRPSLARWQYRAMAQGNIADMAFITSTAQPVPASALGQTGNELQIARRAAGSGTQAMSNIYFLNNPCGAATVSQLPPADSLFTAEPFYTVSEGASTGAVITAIQTSLKNAIGPVSLENPQRGSYAIGTAAPTKATGYLKIDGVAPSRANAISGAYDFYAEETFQWNLAATSATQKSFLGVFATKAGEISTLQSLTADNQVGNMALPAANGGSPAANPTWIARAERGGNNCSPGVRVIE
jgi:hypothetical protein